MNFRRWLSSSSIILVALLILTKYTNCAPMSESELSLSEGGSDEVRVIEDWNKRKVAFFNEVIEAHDASDTVIIDGLCARADHEEVISWAIADAFSPQTHLAGETICERGGFQVQVSGVQNLHCNTNYTLSAKVSDGAQDEVQIRRKCPPLLTSQVTTVEPGAECFVELSVTAPGGPGCQQVCYSQNKVILSESMDNESCQAFQASANEH